MPHSHASLILFSRWRGEKICTSWWEFYTFIFFSDRAKFNLSLVRVSTYAVAFYSVSSLPLIMKYLVTFFFNLKKKNAINNHFKLGLPLPSLSRFIQLFSIEEGKIFLSFKSLIARSKLKLICQKKNSSKIMKSWDIYSKCMCQEITKFNDLPYVIGVLKQCIIWASHLACIFY